MTGPPSSPSQQSSSTHLTPFNKARLYASTDEGPFIVVVVVTWRYKKIVGKKGEFGTFN